VPFTPENFIFYISNVILASCCHVVYSVLVKLFLYMSGRTLGLQEAEAPMISRQSVHEGGNDVSPKHQPPLPSREDFELISRRG
jgi:hypothetical protein